MGTSFRPRNIQGGREKAAAKEAEKAARLKASQEARRQKKETREEALRLLREMVNKNDGSDRQRTEAAKLLLKEIGGRKKKRVVVESERPEEKLTEQELKDLRARVGKEPGWEWLLEYGGLRKFRDEFKLQAERSLYLFAKYVFGMVDLTPGLHRGVCDFLQEPVPKRKLLMLPTQHLKTSIASHALPAHALIQPVEENRYFPGIAGKDIRILLAGETEIKARENLGFIKEQFDRNHILRSLWPECCWKDGARQSPRWTAGGMSIPRERIKPEPSITALGVGTAVAQRHYEMLLLDDLATFAAAQSPGVMEDVDKWRKMLRTRAHHPDQTIEVGIGTHWTMNDVYVNWKNDVTVKVIIRSAIEDGEPIWPERFSIESLESMRREMGDDLFSLLLMNNPVNTRFAALDWGDMRGFEIRGDNLQIMESRKDEELKRGYLKGPLGLFSSLKRGSPIALGDPSAGQEEIAKAQEGSLNYYLRLKYGSRGPYAE